MGQGSVRLFIDKSLSPQPATRLNETGRHEAVHPLHVGRRGEPDHRVLEWCIAEDRVIVRLVVQELVYLAGLK